MHGWTGQANDLSWIPYYTEMTKYCDYRFDTDIYIVYTIVRLRMRKSCSLVPFK